MYTVLVTVTSSGLQRASSNGTPIASAATTSVVAAPGAGRRLRVYKIIVSNGSATATWVHWKANAGTLYYQEYLSQGATVVIDLGDRPWDLTTNKALEMVTSAAGSVEYTVEYDDRLV